MALTVESGPFGERSKGVFNFDTDVLQLHTLYFEGSPRRVLVMFGGETIADSRQVFCVLDEAEGLLREYGVP